MNNNLLYIDSNIVSTVNLWKVESKFLKCQIKNLDLEPISLSDLNNILAKIDDVSYFGIDSDRFCQSLTLSFNRPLVNIIETNLNLLGYSNNEIKEYLSNVPIEDYKVDYITFIPVNIISDHSAIAVDLNKEVTKRFIEVCTSFTYCNYNCSSVLEYGYVSNTKDKYMRAAVFYKEDCCNEDFITSLNKLGQNNLTMNDNEIISYIISRDNVKYHLLTKSNYKEKTNYLSKLENTENTLKAAYSRSWYTSLLKQMQASNMFNVNTRDVKHVIFDDSIINWITKSHVVSLNHPDTINYDNINILRLQGQDLMTNLDNSYFVPNTKEMHSTSTFNFEVVDRFIHEKQIDEYFLYEKCTEDYFNQLSISIDFTTELPTVELNLGNKPKFTINNTAVERKTKSREYDYKIVNIDNSSKNYYNLPVSLGGSVFYSLYNTDQIDSIDYKKDIDKYNKNILDNSYESAKLCAPKYIYLASKDLNEGYNAFKQDFPKTLINIDLFETLLKSRKQYELQIYNKIKFIVENTHDDNKILEYNEINGIFLDDGGDLFRKIKEHVIKNINDNIYLCNKLDFAYLIEKCENSDVLAKVLKQLDRLVNVIDLSSTYVTTMIYSPVDKANKLIDVWSNDLLDKVMYVSKLISLPTETDNTKRKYILDYIENMERMCLTRNLKRILTHTNNNLEIAIYFYNIIIKNYATFLNDFIKKFPESLYTINGDNRDSTILLDMVANFIIYGVDVNRLKTLHSSTTIGIRNSMFSYQLENIYGEFSINKDMRNYFKERDFSDEEIAINRNKYRAFSEKYIQIFHDLSINIERLLPLLKVLPIKFLYQISNDEELLYKVYLFNSYDTRELKKLIKDGLTLKDILKTREKLIKKSWLRIFDEYPDSRVNSTSISTSIPKKIQDKFEKKKFESYIPSVKIDMAKLLQQDTISLLQKVFNDRYNNKQRKLYSKLKPQIEKYKQGARLNIKDIQTIVKEISNTKWCSHYLNDSELPKLCHMSVEILNKNNPLNLITGEATRCCMGLSTKKLLDYVSNDCFSQIVVMNKNKIIATSVLWINSVDTLILDNCEAYNHTNYINEISFLYCKALSALYKKLKFKSIGVGTSFNDFVPFDCIEDKGSRKSHNNIIYAKGLNNKLYKGFYSDANTIYMYQSNKYGVDLPVEQFDVVSL